MAATTASKISQLYVSLFGRAPDSAGLAFWSEALDSGAWTLSSIAKSMFDTTPARAYYPTNATADAVVTTFYTNVLGRAPDAEGLAFWVKEYNAAVTAKDVGGFFAKLITNVVEYKGTDAAGLKSQSLFANKVTVAEFYGTNGGTIAGATAALTGVTEVASTVDTAKTAILNPVVAGQTFTLTTSATSDLLIGTTGNDTFTGTALTYATGDKVIDASTKDTDTFNLALTGAATPDVTNVEIINVTQTSTSAVQLTASSLVGAVSNLTVTRADLSVGGSTIAGNKKVDVQNVNGSVVAKVTAGAGTTDLTVVQATKAGATIDGNTATGTIAFTGAGTVNVDSATGTVTHTALGVTAEDAKALTINAAKASSVTTASGETGIVTINAAAATTITANGVSGGGTISAAKATSITAAVLDDSGVTINAGTFVVANTGITVTGDTTTTDAATIKAAGVVNLVSTTVDKLNLSGNGAAVEYIATATTGAATTVYTLSGDQDVTLSATAAGTTLTTITDTTVGKTTTLNLTAQAAAADLSKVATDVIKLSAAQAAASALTLGTGANLVLAKDQANGLIVAGKAAGATINISTADDTAADGTAIDIVTAGTVTVSSNISTVNLDATVGKYTINSTPVFTAATTATVNVTGTKDVTLGTVTAATVNAANLTGKLSLTSAVTPNIYGGSGADTIVINGGAVVFNVDAGNGANVITATAAEVGSVIASGTGADTINVNTANAIVVSAGAGNDTVTIGSTLDSDAILVGGDGTDSLVFAQTGASINLSDNTNFSFRAFETLDVSALASAAHSVTISAAQFAGQTFTVKGNAAADSLIITAIPSTTAATIDASTITVDTATLTLVGSTKSDTITGSAGADVITATAGSDVIDGGAGLDTYAAATASQGTVVNLSTSAISATTVLSKTGLFTADAVTSVAAGKTGQLFTASGSTNLADQQTLSNIENVTGTAGKDYIVGSVGANVITGGAGVDYLVGGLGADTFVYATGDASTGTATLATALTLAANDTIVGAEVIADIEVGDKIDLGYAAIVDAGAFLLAAGKYTYASGAYNAATGTFTVGTAGTAGADTVLYFDSVSTANVQAAYIVLVGVTNAEMVAAVNTAGVLAF